jgi:DNA-binding transcriptional LysR family regulator
LALESLAGEPFIVFPRSIGGHFYTRLMKMFHDAGFTPIVAQEAAQMHVAVGLVSAHIGVALVPASLQLLPVAGVVYKPLLRQKERAEIAIAWRRTEASPAVRAFIDVAVDVIGKGVAGIRKGKR